MNGARAFFRSSKTFLIIWAGQFVSSVGTAMTRFGLLVWAYEQTGSATALALLGAVGYIPYVLIGPLAGVLVDRWDRRRVLLWADAGAACLTAGLFALLALGRLDLVHLYLYEALTGLLDAFQSPAGTAAVTVLVPEEEYGRANGLESLADSAARVLAPALAGLLVALSGLRAVLVVDLATFGAACVTLLWARIPRPPVSDEGRDASRRGLGAELPFGLAYIRAHAGLGQLLLIHTAVNLLAALTYFGILPAMVLARSGGSEVALGAVQTGLGLGGVVGGLLFSSWGGPRRRVLGYLASVALSYACGDLLFALGRSTPVWVVGALGATVSIPFIIGCYDALWQRSVPPDVQGRVLAVRNTLQTAVTPLGYVAGGLLADRLFEPALRAGGPLVPLFGRLVGSGAGAGMGLMFLCTGVGGILLGLSGYALPALRRLDGPALGEEAHCADLA